MNLSYSYQKERLMNWTVSTSLQLSNNNIKRESLLYSRLLRMLCFMVQPFELHLFKCLASSLSIINSHKAQITVSRFNSCNRTFNNPIVVELLLHNSAKFNAVLSSNVNTAKVIGQLLSICNSNHGNVLC